MQEFRYGRRDLRASVPCYSCRQCEFEYLDDLSEVRRHAAVCKHLGRLTPSEIRAIRERAKATKAEFAQVNGLEEATIARWETGALIQGAAHDLILRRLRQSAL